MEKYTKKVVMLWEVRNFMSGQLTIDMKNFIIERMTRRIDTSCKLDIAKAVSEVIEFDNEFFELMKNGTGYSTDDEIGYITSKTGYETEFVKLLLWQKLCYKMMQGLWEYDSEVCLKCNNSRLLLKEVEDVDFAVKVVCQKCGYEKIIGNSELEPYRAAKDWLEYLDENISFPFKAEVCEHQEGELICIGDQLKVHSIEGEDDLYGVIVAVRKGRKKYFFSLIDLEPIDLDENGKKVISEYKGYFGYRYELVPIVQLARMLGGKQGRDLKKPPKG